MSLTKMAKLSMSIADITCCAICLESFTRPKMLPCQHTYCYSCLLSLCPSEEQTQITCPQCREIHNIPTGGISNFRDNIMANNLLEVGVMKEEALCLDCELRPSVSVCEHCDSNICAQCLVDHIKLSMELKMSLKDVQENLAMPKSDVKKEKLKTSKEELGKQLGILKDLQKRKLQKLAHLYRESATLESFIGIIGQVYDELSSRNSDDSYCASLTQKLDKCTTVQSLKGLKSHVSDLKTVVRLLQSSDDDLRFVPGQDSDQFGHLEIGQAVLNLRGKYESDISLDEVFQLFPELRRKVEQSEPNSITTEQQSSAIRLTADTEDIDAGEAGAQQIEPGREKDNEADDIDRIKAIRDAVCSQTDAMEEQVDEVVHVCSTPPPLQPIPVIKSVSPTFVEVFLTLPQSVLAANSSGKTVLEPDSSAPVLTVNLPRPVAPRPPVPAPPLHQYHPNQNQLPENVDYNSKGKGRIQIIGRGKNFDACDKLRNPQGVAYFAANDEIFVADNANDRIMAYTSDGRHSRVFSNVHSPRDLAISNDELIYIAITTGFLIVNKVGLCVRTIETCSLGPLNDCCSIACYEEFTVLISGNDAFHCVFIFDSDGREVRHFGGKHLKDPSGIGISRDGTMYITDDDEKHIKVFRWNGQYLYNFLDAKESRAYGEVAVDGDGFVCVANKVSDTIDVFDQTRRRISRVSSRGKRYGQLDGPWRLTFTPDGRLIVADKENNRVQIF